MIKRPVFTFEDKDVMEVDIPPGGRYTVSIKCLGKVGWYVTFAIRREYCADDIARMVRSG